MIKILFLINTLGGGGAEKVLVNLVNNMNSYVFDITVETMFSGGVNQDLLHPDINYICQNAFTIKGISHIYKFLPSGYLYKKYIGSEKYDIIVAYMHNLPIKVITGCKDKHTKLIGWCHCGTVDKSTYCTCWHTKKRANATYNKCDAIVGVSKYVINELKKFFDITTDCYAIYNTNDTKRISRLAKEKPGVPVNRNRISVCTVGRLSYEKGNDRLIDVAHRLFQENYNFDVYFMGEGAENDRLVSLVKDYEIEDRIHFTGFQKSAYAIVNECDFFVCPSRTEGFSTAVTEAVLLGKPVVSTDVSGAKEILGENNEYGIVTENSTEGLYNGVKQLLDHPEQLQNYRNQARIRAEKFTTEKTVARTEELFKNILNS